MVNLLLTYFLIDVSYFLFYYYWDFILISSSLKQKSTNVMDLYRSFTHSLSFPFSFTNFPNFLLEITLLLSQPLNLDGTHHTPDPRMEINVRILFPAPRAVGLGM